MDWLLIDQKLESLRRALCRVDVGAHLVTVTDSPAPVTMGGIFDVLSASGIINADVAAQMKRAVGFRNVAVHGYEAINWHIVFAIVQNHITDFENFARDVHA